MESSLALFLDDWEASHSLAADACEGINHLIK